MKGRLKLRLKAEQIEEARLAKHGIILHDPWESYDQSCKMVHDFIKINDPGGIEQYFGQQLSQSEIDSMINYHKHETSLRNLIKAWDECTDSAKESFIEDIYFLLNDMGIERELIDKNIEQFDLKNLIMMNRSKPIEIKRGRKIDRDFDAKVMKLSLFWANEGLPIVLGNLDIYKRTIKCTDMVYYMARYLSVVSPLPPIANKTRWRCIERNFKRAHGAVRQLIERGLLTKANAKPRKQVPEI